jgi:hypothetical protein
MNPYLHHPVTLMKPSRRCNRRCSRGTEAATVTEEEEEEEEEEEGASF